MLRGLDNPDSQPEIECQDDLSTAADATFSHRSSCEFARGGKYKKENLKLTLRFVEIKTRAKTIIQLFVHLFMSLSMIIILSEKERIVKYKKGL